MTEYTLDKSCQELNNIKYKSMLLPGNTLSSIKENEKESNNMDTIDKFLEIDKKNNTNEPWCKLNKTIKTRKLMDYVEKYKKTNNLTHEEGVNLLHFFKDCLDRKKLHRVKDVIYDKENGTIKDIPALTYVKSTKHFTLKNIDKRVSTLKSLAPKKINGTIRKKEASVIDSDEEK